MSLTFPLVLQQEDYHFPRHLTAQKFYYPNKKTNEKTPIFESINSKKLLRNEKFDSSFILLLNVFHFQIGKCEKKQREFSRSPKSFSRTSFPFARRSFILAIRQFDLNSEREWFVFVENQKKIQKVFLWKFKKIKFQKKKILQNE